MHLDAQQHRYLISHDAFANSDGVEARRRIHENHSQPSIDIVQWVLSRYEWQGNERVLDVGSGTGNYAGLVQAYTLPQNYIALDLSPGMAKAAAEFAPGSALVADAEALPFPDHCFDVILANFMLYHAYDVDQALAEIHRVLHPEGVLIAATSSQYFNMKEFDTLIQRAFRLLGFAFGDAEASHLPLRKFSLESGTMRLGRHFKSVARYDLPGTLIFTEAQPVVEYIDSLHPFYKPLLPAEVAWDDFMMIMSDQVNRFIKHFGELIVSKLSGVLVATDDGGFAAEYQRIRQASSPE